MLQQEKYGGEKSLNMAFMRVLPNAIGLYKKHPQNQNNAGNHDQQSHALKSYQGAFQGAFAKKPPQKTFPFRHDQQKRKRHSKNISQNAQKQPALTTPRTSSSLPLTEKIIKTPRQGKQTIPFCRQGNEDNCPIFQKNTRKETFYIKSLTHPHHHPLSSKEKIDARAELSV